MGRLRVFDVGPLRQPQRRDLRIVARIETHDIEVGVRRPFQIRAPGEARASAA